MGKKGFFRWPVIGLVIMPLLVVVAFAPSSVIAQPPPPDIEMGSVVLSAEPSSIPADGVSTSVITATVWDKDGMLIGLVTVELNTTLGTITASNITSCNSTSFGTATAILTAGETTGNATITATAIIPGEPSPWNTTVVVLYPPGTSVTFGMPTKVVIGEEVEIKGGVHAGDKIDIRINDEYNPDVDDQGDEIAIDENNEFAVEWDTEGYMPGSYTIKAYIDCNCSDEDCIEDNGIDDDGSITIRLVEPGLTAEQPRNVIAEGDDYTLKGTATGVDEVDIVLVGSGGWKSGFATPSILAGILIGATSVTDDEFSEDTTMTEGLDMGVWVTLVLAPGRDGMYETGEGAGELTLAALGVTEGKNQDQIVAIIEDATINQSGSDDLMEMLTFEVETGYVRLNPVESVVVVGELLNISGITNREQGTTINISTLAGQTSLSALTEVEWPTADEGVFTASIDTTNAEPGTYTLEADDGDGNTDTVTTEIGPSAPTPPPPRRGGRGAPRDSDGDGISDIDEMLAGTDPNDPCDPNPECAACLALRPPVPMSSPTATPTISPTVAPSAASPTPPSPTPPGFELVFAIAALFAVTYLMLRRKQ